MKLEVRGLDDVNRKLSRISAVEWAALKALQGADMKNRANSITPFDSGDLRKSAAFDGKDTFGYGMEYAPHVEYGHRVIIHGQQHGYVEGQHYLQQNVTEQEPKYKQDVLDWLRRHG